MTEVVQPSPSKQEALSSIPSTTEKEKKRTKLRERITGAGFYKKQK
jgi:hypothetical protein